MRHTTGRPTVWRHTFSKAGKRLASASFILLFLTAPVFAQTDVAGSADPGGLERFSDAWIEAYEEVDFDAARIATGPIERRGAYGDSLELEGRVVRLRYRFPPAPSLLEIARNYESSLEAAGFELLYSCDGSACGGYDFFYTVPSELGLGTFGNLDSFRYLAARKAGGEGAPEAHLSLLVSKNPGNGNTYGWMTYVETEGMADSMVDAAAMQEGLDAAGKIALYGIHFDLDSAAVRESSAPTLEQIATLLRDRPELEILVVGHTDNQGSLDYNMRLSRERAAAVVEALVRDYGIAAERLSGQGAGFLAPVATNRTEEGRALNRRVELVER
jgi:outer membrane protein OmpA-like peptidoglycan-associated protein